MKLTATIQDLHLTERFTIARGSTEVEPVVVVQVEHDGIVGFGEGAPVDYHGESAESMLAFIEAEGASVIGRDPFDLERVHDRLRESAGPTGAGMAIDGALHDWLGKRAGLPLHQVLGLPSVTPPTSFTLGIDTVEATGTKARRAVGFEVLKIKVGGPDDLERLEAVRSNSPARIRIDGNEGWTIETARDLMPVLVEMGVEFVEQPFPRDDLDSYRRLRELPDRIPVMIDEGCTDLASVAAIATYADGINVKLSKCRGIREAVRMVHAARALGLATMLGCMIESQLGIAQGAHISPLFDYIDLDGHLLISNQPFVGLGLAAGRIVLPAAPGLGVSPS